MIADATTEDTGTYNITASDDYGSTTGTFKITVGPKSEDKGATDEKKVEKMEPEPEHKAGLMDVMAELQSQDKSKKVKKFQHMEQKDIATLKVKVWEVAAEPKRGIQRRGTAPKIDIAREPVVVKEGDLLRITCKITGQPACSPRSLDGATNT